MTGTRKRTTVKGERGPKNSIFGSGTLANKKMEDLPPEEGALREFIADLNAAATLMRKLRRSLAAVADMTAAEYATLIGVWYCERSGKSSVRDIANHMHIAAAHVTAELGKLEDARLVTKEQSKRDKRVVEIKLTKKADELLDVLASTFKEVNMVLFAGLTYADMIVVHNFFRRIIDQGPEAVALADARAAKAARTSN